MNYILSGDIGGTKTLLQISAADNDRVPILKKSFPSTQYLGLAEIMQDFLHQAKVTDIAAACFALAGPVLNRRVTLTNLPWSVDADEIGTRFGIPVVNLINDFEAVGVAIEALQPTDLLTLQPGKEQEHGTRLAVGAGTGLGVAWVVWRGGSYQVHSSEGGHMDFAPLDATQYELQGYLQARYGHVSYERIVSGPGMVSIFEFLRDSGRAAPSTRLLGAIATGDAAAAIVQSAEQDNEPIAVMALDLFISVYGAFVGNLALLTLPHGGIYVAGGIAAKIAKSLQRRGFMRGFHDKGRFSGMLKMLPLHIVTHPDAGLLGAHRIAQRADASAVDTIRLL